ncbi:unnamed protein product [Calicophoron daubneyi]|uniref:Cilia- and flagella-associated protein 97 n=1 Tax=Calicophoron daubneyi TaxID=300641 RepID=A0AAV2TFE2_CALDB
MAAKIIPDSFKALSLDLSEDIDFEFFEESHGEAEHSNHKGSSSKKMSDLKVEDKTQKNEIQRRGDVLQTEKTLGSEDDDSDNSITYNSDDNSIELHSLDANQTVIPVNEPHLSPHSQSKTPSRSYESDFSTFVESSNHRQSGSADTKSLQQNGTDEEKRNKLGLDSEDEEDDEKESQDEDDQPHLRKDGSDGLSSQRYRRSVATPTYGKERWRRKSDKNGVRQRASTSQAEDLEELSPSHISRALSQLSRRLNATHIRPPWCDPNSKPLPSDRTTSFYDLYDEFTRANQSRTLSASSCSFSNHDIAVYRPYHATLNRFRQQEKIQMENYMLAKRLENIRPTPGITRREQLRDYKRYFMPSNAYAIQRSLHARPDTASSGYYVDYAGDRDSQYSGSLGGYSRSSSQRRESRAIRSAGLRCSASTNNAASSANESPFRESCFDKGRRRTGREPSMTSATSSRAPKRRSVDRRHSSASRPPRVPQRSGERKGRSSVAASEMNQHKIMEGRDIPTPPPPSPLNRDQKYHADGSPG